MTQSSRQARERREMFMDRALELAGKAKGKTSPNPPVGCVIAKRGRIIAEGYHQKAGSDHAEIVALKKAGSKARGATLYVTLEPCSHWGKTPPCAEAIIKAGIKRVIISSRDPNGQVSSIPKLRRAGIEIITCVRRKEGDKLTEHHRKFITAGRPFVTLKLALSLDGCVATRGGDSRYLTSPESLKEVHHLRTEHDAIMVGINTVLADNPRLTPRRFKGRDPLKIVVDPKARIPLDCHLLERPGQLFLVVCADAPKARLRRLEQRGITLIQCPAEEGRIGLKQMMRRLGQKGITSILAEGGPTLATSLMERKLVDKLMLFYAPLIIGGGIQAMQGLGINKIKDAWTLKDVSWRKVGQDMLFEGYP